MEIFFGFIYANPYLSIAYVFAFFAAIAFLVFLRGFLSGFMPLFTLEGHSGHMAHHRTRAVWGVLLLAFIFVLWEIVRWFAGLFT